MSEQVQKTTLSVPNNGHEVLYLFSKFHKALGFEKISRISNLWLEAVRHGKPVNVRIQYTTKQFLKKYEFKWAYGCYVGSKWIKDGDMWKVIRKDGTEGIQQIPDPNNKYTVSPLRQCLFHKTMKDLVDVLVCWKINSKVEKGIEVLELSKLFTIETKHKHYHVMKTRYRDGRRLQPSQKLLMLLYEKGEIAELDFFRLVEAMPQSIRLMIKRFEKCGWITVTRQDGRLKFYSLTKAGREHILAKYFWSKIHEKELVLGVKPI